MLGRALRAGARDARRCALPPLQRHLSAVVSGSCSCRGPNVSRLIRSSLRVHRSQCYSSRVKTPFSAQSRSSAIKLFRKSLKTRKLKPQEKHHGLKQQILRSLRRVVSNYISHPHDHSKLVRVRSLVRQICDRAAEGQRLQQRHGRRVDLLALLSKDGSGVSSQGPGAPVVFSPVEHTVLISTVAQHGLWQESLRLLQLAHDTGKVGDREVLSTAKSASRSSM